jgi:RimJ/RimL family protein N-acetyltransferase
MCDGPEADRAFTSLPAWYSEAAARAWIDRQARRRAGGTTLALALTRPAEAAVALGNVNLVRFSADGRQGALGYWLVPAARGRGLATAAARLLCAWGFAELGLERIELAIVRGNDASIRVAERLGARREDGRRGGDAPGGRKLLTYALRPTELSDFR